MLICWARAPRRTQVPTKKKLLCLNHSSSHYGSSYLSHDPSTYLEDLALNLCSCHGPQGSLGVEPPSAGADDRPPEVLIHMACGHLKSRAPFKQTKLHEGSIPVYKTLFLRVRGTPALPPSAGPVQPSPAHSARARSFVPPSHATLLAWHQEEPGGGGVKQRAAGGNRLWAGFDMTRLPISHHSRPHVVWNRQLAQPNQTRGQRTGP